MSSCGFHEIGRLGSETVRHGAQGAEAGSASTFANEHLAGQSRPASPTCGSKGMLCVPGHTAPTPCSW